MDVFVASENCVIANVYGIPIEFYMTDLNGTLGNRDGGCKVYTTKSRLNFLCYSHTSAANNICKRSDFSDDECRGILKSRALCLQV